MLGHSQTWITYNYICIEWAKQDKLLQEYAQAS